MPTRSVKVAVFARLRPPATRWGTATLTPCAVVWPAPPGPPAVVAREGAVETWRLRDAELTLHSGDTAHQRENLASGRPSVWVAIEPGADPAATTVRLVTVDPHEGGGLAEDAALVVEATPMPPALALEIEAFVAAHHVEIPFVKRKRAPATPPADPRAPRVLRPEDKWGRR